jgi:hypothetical protein
MERLEMVEIAVAKKFGGTISAGRFLRPFFCYFVQTNEMVSPF